MNRKKKTNSTTTTPTPRFPLTPEAFEQLAIENLYHRHGQAVQSASHHDVYMALSYTVRDYLIERRRQTTEAHFAANPKFVYYLSAEFLPGKQLEQNMLYTDTLEAGARSAGQAQPASGRLYRPGRRTGAGQRRSGAVSGVLHRFPGDAGHPGCRLRHSLRVRHFSPDVRGRLAGRATRWLANVRQPLGIPPVGRHGADRLLGAHRDVRRGKWKHSDAVGAQPPSAGRTMHHTRARIPDHDRQHPATVAGASHRRV